MKNLGTYLKESSTSVTTDLDVPASALAIGAHPDDIEFGCGGTLAKWAAQGCEVSSLILTDGSKGSWDPITKAAELKKIRERETRRAANVLTGSRNINFLEQVDGELEYSRVNVEEIAKVVRQIKPLVVLTHDPWKKYRIHPDHRNTGWLVMDALAASRDQLFYSHLDLPPHRPLLALLWEAEEIDHFEDISSTIEVKYRALLQHRSQLHTTMGIDDPEDASQLRRFHDLLIDIHEKVGNKFDLPPCEEFKLMSDF